MGDPNVATNVEHMGRIHAGDIAAEHVGWHAARVKRFGRLGLRHFVFLKGGFPEALKLREAVGEGGLWEK